MRQTYLKVSYKNLTLLLGLWGIMNKRFIFLLIGLLPGNIFCQKLVTEAIFDENDKSRKIERKYFYPEDSSILYVRIENEEITAIRQKRLYHGDTQIVIEEYRSLKKTKSEIEAENLFSISTGVIGDTNIISYRFHDGSELNDTILPGKKPSIILPAARGIHLVSDVLEHRFDFSLDSLTLDETVSTYSINNELKKIEIITFDSRYKVLINFRTDQNGMIAHRLAIVKDSIPKLLALDSVSWNIDKSTIVWKTFILSDGRSYPVKYVFNETSMCVFQKNTLSKRIKFSEKIDLFNYVLLNNTVYDDPLYGMDLLHFDRRQIVSIKTPKWRPIFYTYKIDQKNRIIEQIKHGRHKVYQRITYTYFEP